MSWCYSLVSHLGVTPKNPYFRHKKSLDKQGFKFEMVPGDGIEPPTQGFSVPCSTN